MIKSIREIVEETDTIGGKLFDISIQVLILISIVCFSLETLPDLTETQRLILEHIELVSVIIFTVEYLLRLILADKKLGFALSFYGIIDFLAILPFYLSLGIDLRSLRILRLLRVFRVLKMARYNKAIRHFKNAFLDVKEELVLFSVVIVMLIYLASVGIYYFERDAQPEAFQSIIHSMWWSLVTLTTVGYGDVYPITLGGRIFTFFVLMIGMSIVAIPAGLFASALSKTVNVSKE